jgi:hypothetical protein
MPALSKVWCLFTEVHGVTYPKIVIFIFTVTRNLNLTAIVYPLSISFRHASAVIYLPLTSRIFVQSFYCMFFRIHASRNIIIGFISHRRHVINVIKA